MPRFAANLSLMYADLPFLDRFEAAAADGFRAIECQFPYAWPADEIARRLADLGLEAVLINTPASSVGRAVADRGMHPDERGLGCLPGREDDFRSAFVLALEYATTLGCPRIHAMVGVLPPGIDPDRARDTLVSNLQWACERSSDVAVLIEPINRRDIPGYFIDRQADAHAVVAAVGSPRAKVLMDLYHCQVTEGDVATKLRSALPGGSVGHLQIAGVPERQEPDVGELNYRYLFDAIDALGWPGWIGCEYRPKDASAGGTSRGLAWMR